MGEVDGHAQLEDLAGRFSETEAALRSLLQAAERLTGAREELVVARTGMERTQADAVERLEEARRTIREQLEAADDQSVERLEATVAAVESRLAATEKTVLARFEDAESSLDVSQKALADTASAVYGLTNELKDIARDLKDSAVALRALDPDRISRQLDDLAQSSAATAAQQKRAQVLLLVVLVAVVVVGLLAAIR